MPNEEAVILSAVRTAVGKFQGALSEISATQLGATVVREELRVSSRRCSSPSRTHYAQMEGDSVATLVRLAAKFTHRAAEKL